MVEINDPDKIRTFITPQLKYGPSIECVINLMSEFVSTMKHVKCILALLCDLDAVLEEENTGI